MEHCTKGSACTILRSLLASLQKLTCRAHDVQFSSLIHRGPYGQFYLGTGTCSRLSAASFPCPQDLSIQTCSQGRATAMGPTSSTCTGLSPAGPFENSLYGPVTPKTSRIIPRIQDLSACYLGLPQASEGSSKCVCVCVTSCKCRTNFPNHFVDIAQFKGWEAIVPVGQAEKALEAGLVPRVFAEQRRPHRTPEAARSLPPGEATVWDHTLAPGAIARGRSPTCLVR